ncbi:MAG: hypothetical protein RL345_160, partial [Chloroflexota bacterium]
MGAFVGKVGNEFRMCAGILVELDTEAG